MNSKRKIVTLSVASATAIITALFARDYIAGGTQPQQVVVQQVESAEVLVITQDVQFGEVVQSSMLEWRKWPQDHLLPGMITRQDRPDAIEELAGYRARAPMVAGEPLLENRLVAREEGGLLSTLIPAGMRAMSIPVSLETGVGGFVMPNDRVDVILTRSVSGTEGGGEKRIADTVLENVRVLAIDQLYAGEQVDAPSVEDMATITLEVTPKQAQVLAQVQSLGELSLALRALDERRGKNADVRPRLSPKFARNASGGVRFYRFGWPSMQAYGN